MPVVREIDGDPTWVLGDVGLSRAGASGVVGVDGTKVPGLTVFTWRIEDVHPGAHSVAERLEMMDDQGIWAQIVYPNTVGFGGQRFGQVADPEVRLMAARIYNDAMAELQEASSQRLFPMGVLPWWDVELAVAEIGRMHELGLHGINTTAAPNDHGLPDLADPRWDPIWEAASDLALPVNFHIGSSDSATEWFGTVPWPSLGPEQKLGIGSAMLYLTTRRCWPTSSTRGCSSASRRSRSSRSRAAWAGSRSSCRRSTTRSARWRRAPWIT